jgi:hypothetical protein
MRAEGAGYGRESIAFAHEVFNLYAIEFLRQRFERFTACRLVLVGIEKV